MAREPSRFAAAPAARSEADRVVTPERQHRARLRRRRDLQRELLQDPADLGDLLGVRGREAAADAAGSTRSSPPPIEDEKPAPVTSAAPAIVSPFPKWPPPRPDLHPSSLQRLDPGVWALLFAWLAVPFALRVDGRGHIAGPAVAAVGTISLFYAAQTAGLTLAQRELLPVGVTSWATMALFAVLPILSLRFRPR